MAAEPGAHGSAAPGPLPHPAGAIHFLLPIESPRFHNGYVFRTIGIIAYLLSLNLVEAGQEESKNQ